MSLGGQESRQADPTARWSDAIIAASLFAVDPAGLAGIALRALPGPVRDAFLAKLRDLLPDETPWRRMPATIDDDRLLGGLDLVATLNAGRPIVGRGLLAEADGGIVLVTTAERLSAGTAARIGSVLDTGQARIERDGIALVLPTRIGIVAIDEGMEDDEILPASLRDRMAFAVDLGGISIREMPDIPITREAVREARERLSRVVIGEDEIAALCHTAVKLGIASLRVPLLAIRAARAAAALSGRESVDDKDLRDAARLVLAPRALILPDQQEQEGEGDGGGEGRLARASRGRTARRARSRGAAEPDRDASCERPLAAAAASRCGQERGRFGCPRARPPRRFPRHGAKAPQPHHHDLRRRRLRVACAEPPRRGQGRGRTAAGRMLCAALVWRAPRATGRCSSISRPSASRWRRRSPKRWQRVTFPSRRPVRTSFRAPSSRPSQKPEPMAARLVFGRDGRDWPNREASRFVEAGGIRWHVQRMGAGLRLLLVHGTAATTHSWRTFMPELAQNFDVVAFDLPGHGFTDPLNNPATLPAMARAVGALVERLDIAPDLAVGHSAGAAILLRMALDGRFAPKGILGINAALLPFRGAASHIFSPLAKLLVLNPLVPRLFAWRASDSAATERLIRQTGSTIDEEGLALYARAIGSPAHVKGALAMMARWDLAPLLADMRRLSIPLHLIVGEKDRAVAPEEARRIRGHAPGVSVEYLPGVGHLAHEERPREVAQRVLAFTDRVAGGES